jgi:polyhydroxyalkanoate synthase subunit PhaE
MSEADKNIFDPKNFFDTWMRSMSGLWPGMEQFSFQSSTTRDAKEKTSIFSPRFDTQVQSSMNAWQALTSILSQPETMHSAYNGISSLPEFFLKMLQPALENISGMFQKWLAQIEKTESISEQMRFDHLDKDTLNIFTSLYDAEFRKFLQIPQLGIAREYQERINRFFDSFNLLQSAMAEFLNIVFQPFEKTHPAFQEKIADLAKKNELPDDPKFYYQAWLKILEREYMALFKTPEYLTALAKALHATAEYKQAKRDLCNDLLHEFSIPSSADVEGVYKDLHDIKKRLRNIEKKINN